MFEKATRLKLRFPYRGLCTVEDLWDLSVKELDSIFKVLNVAAKTSKEESLLDIKSKEDEVIELQISIIKYIVTIKCKEAEERENKKVKSEKKQQLLEILSKKKNADLENKSVEDLEKMVAELD